MSYEINYEDQKFKDVEAEKKTAISDLDKTYGSMVNDSADYYKEQVDATKEWEKKQTELQNQQTDFAIKEIEQKKDLAKKDYTKEQSGAYADWKKQSDPTGVRAEQIADQGMQNTGYAESSQVGMYNAYQNRVATARESYVRIVQDFDNDITRARLQNSSALAEIAFQSLQKRLELNLQGFQYKNSLLLEQSERKIQLDQMYHERWKDVLDQMNTENALAEEIRQFNEQMAEQQRQFNFHNKLGEFANPSGGSGGGGSGGGGGSSRRYSGGGGSSGSSASIKKSGSSSGVDLPSETAKSILALGQGPISSSNLAGQVASGKVTQSTSSSGNPVFNYSGSAASSGAKPIASSSSSSSGGSWISKAVDTVKSWFK